MEDHSDALNSLVQGVDEKDVLDDHHIEEAGNLIL